MEDANRLTPMFAQYKSIKKKYADALLFFHMGDFYEMFFEDAITASRELQIALTTRGKNTENAAPMCGVPRHAAQSYLAQLIDRGYSVAICEQVEDPRLAKGLVRREVTSVITPGTILDENSLGPKEHNFLGAIFCGMHETCAFAWADVSTGQWTGIQFRQQTEMWQWVGKIAPAELLLMDGKQLPAGLVLEKTRIVRQPAINFDLKKAAALLEQAQKVKELGALGLDTKPDLARACGAILAYLDQTQIGKTSQLLPFKPLETGKRMLIDEFTEKNLEIFQRLNGKKGKGTLRFLLDETVTPMGGRLLEDMLRHPFRDIKTIRQIQGAVAWYFAHPDHRAKTRSALAGISDLERILMRISLGRSSSRDLINLRLSLEAIPEALAPLLAAEMGDLPKIMQDMLNNVDQLEDLTRLLTSAIEDEPAAGLSDKSIFKAGFNAELDAQMDLVQHGEEKIQKLFEMEREESGLARLKRGYNKIIGHYYEILRSNIKDNVPDHFNRRQSLANAERYVTEALKQLEEDLLLASDRVRQLENEIYANLCEHIVANKARIIQTADIIGHIDYWQTLAEVATHENWVMPDVMEEAEIHIKGGRHPVVESIIGSSNFVPNDYSMDAKKRMCLLTGPNMAGKSTILRQVALICILAQMGSMVPAQSAAIGVVDRLFSRVGASDNLAQGQSTFMVEMMETARIVRQATRRSLIILDEIGRGTSTFDGMAIAWAVVEDLANRCQKQLRTIFATHYHELTALESHIEGLFTMNIAVGAYDNKEILFLHRLVPGPSDKSYGIEVARLAGVPYPIVQRARDILKSLEGTKDVSSIKLPLPGFDKNKKVRNEILEEIRNLELAGIDPDNALQLILKWQKRLSQSG